ncbi:hypothetical protein C8Q78DRAFT_1071605 [Trametes maxima]|nr:hypothetical protein C8Q78DRAFT_1071605 [Trametes maxima]
MDTLRRPPPRPVPADDSSPLPAVSSPQAPLYTDTQLNHFGVFHRYTVVPQHNPEDGLTIDTFTDLCTHTRPGSTPLQCTPLHSFGDATSEAFAPFANVTVFKLMHWFYSGSSQKTPLELNRVVDIFLVPEFRAEHIEGFDATHETVRLDQHTSRPNVFAAGDGWREGKVKVHLPKERDAPELEVSGAASFHWMPFKLFRRGKADPLSTPDPPPPEQLYSDAYTADAMLEENERVQHKACKDQEPGDPPDLEYVAVSLIFASDSTHLTNFGNASLWPIYPTCQNTFECGQLPLTIQTAYQEIYGEPVSAAVLRFCKRELMQQIWLLLLDDDFVKAYVHRIDKIHLLGTPNDMWARVTRARKDDNPVHLSIAAARRNIFEHGAPSEGSTVEGILGATSTTPTLHLVRILIAAGRRLVQEMDERDVYFSQVPSFGWDTICKFGANVSGFKKLAAPDYEDLLQCSLPVFEGLLPPRFNRIVLDMLFVLATWHAHAHHCTGSSLMSLCTEYDTWELPKETVARFCHAKTPSANAHPTGGAARVKKAPANWKAFNLYTYKLHRLGDHAGAIRRVGTVENSSTQTPELEHRRVKRFYVRTNKNTTFGRQIALHMQRERYLNQMHTRTTSPTVGKPTRNCRPRKIAAWEPTCQRQRPLHLRFEVSETLPPASAKLHTQISDEQTHYEDIMAYVNENSDDPAFKDFVHKLCVHALQRLTGIHTGHHNEGDPTPTELRTLQIERNRMYVHKIMRVNYTSYDMRHSLNPRSHPDVMMLALHGSAHPYLYARIISIFHINVLSLDPNNPSEASDSEQLHVLWVRWFKLDTTTLAGFNPFSFIAPSQILCAVHLIPAFHHGRTDAYLPFPSVTRGESCDNDDFKFYYIRMWSDRNLFMRFLGSGVGHQHHGKTTTWSAAPGEGPDDSNANEEDLPNATSLMRPPQMALTMVKNLYMMTMKKTKKTLHEDIIPLTMKMKMKMGMVMPALGTLMWMRVGQTVKRTGADQMAKMRLRS